MEHVVMTVRRIDGSFLSMASTREGAMEIGKRLIYTFPEYDSSIIVDENKTPLLVIDKGMPDWRPVEVE